MSTRTILFFLLLVPVFALAQVQTPPPAPFNAPTMAVLLANRPAHDLSRLGGIEQTKWLEMMEQPVNRSLYPLRVTQAMLDTLDGTLLDRRFNYIMGR